MDEYIKAASERLQLNEDVIKLTKILRKSLDGSSKEAFYWEVSIVVSVPEDFDNSSIR